MCPEYDSTVPHRRRAARLAVLAFAAASTPAWAQVPPAFAPNAGTILNIFAPPTAEPSLPAWTLPRPAEEQPVADAAAGARVMVSRVVVDGVTLLPTAEVEALVAGFGGREATLGELRQGAERITARYRERGYFLARAYLPAQEIVGGVVRIAVIEGRFDKVEATGSARLSDRVVQDTLAAQGVVAGQSVAQAGLERSLILLEQQGGAPATALLQPGATLGTSALSITTPAGPLFNGTLGADNFGNRFTGEARATASLALNSPLRLGDRANLWLAHSTGADAVFGAYQIPVGSSGLVLGATASYYRYDLCCEFAALDRAGEAAVGGIQARYPIVLRQDALAWTGLAFERKRLTDTWLGGDLDDKRANVVTAAVDGIAAGLGGQVRYRVAASGGDLELKGPPDAIRINAATIDTEGRYAKLWGNAELTVPLARWNFLNLRVAGQMASRNLDSSEKFILGGFNGIRAYPEGEAAGDNAWLARLDWVVPLTFVDLPGKAAVRAFVDAGAVWIVDSTRGGLAASGFRNHYSLSGTGAGLNWNLPRGFALTAYVATAIGDNPGASLNGNNADGKSNDTRGWIGAEWAF
jgi:hemolysin activation/secretion protein